METYLPPNTSVLANCNTVTNRVEGFVSTYPDNGAASQWVFIELFWVDVQTGQVKASLSTGRAVPSYASAPAILSGYWFGRDGHHLQVQGKVYKYSWNGRTWDWHTWQTFTASHTSTYGYTVHPYSTQTSSCLL